MAKHLTAQQNIIPTFISTDLVTPGKPKRQTLPGIGTRPKEVDKLKLWGQETRQTNKQDVLAYHHFKPSHLTHAQNGSTVVVTHRHFGSRSCNFNTNDQPYEVTRLFLSKCRLNDQRIPQPFESKLVHQYYIPEPYPKAFCNSYFSHRCKFQVFPTNGVDLKDNDTRPTSASKFKLKDQTKLALSDLHKRYYDTTTYNNEHEKALNHHQTPPAKKRKSTAKIKVYHRTCKLCGKKINNNKKQEKTTKNKGDDTKEQRTNKRSYPIIYWPLGEENIKDTQLDYPKIKLPKYCLRPQVFKKSKRDMEEQQDFCTCKGDVPVMISSVMVTQSQEKIIQNHTKKIGNEKSTHSLKQPAHSHKEDTVPMIKSSATTKPTRYERGVKTEARHKFLKDYEQDALPDLRHAMREGRKHDFFGWNVNFFRG